MSDDRKEAGHELKHLGVIWKDLTVEVIQKKTYGYCSRTVQLTLPYL